MRLAAGDHEYLAFKV
jgi:hypothetical protein